jgi:hypothetical protein
MAAALKERKRAAEIKKSITECGSDVAAAKQIFLDMIKVRRGSTPDTGMHAECAKHMLSFCDCSIARRPCSALLQAEEKSPACSAANW